MLDTLSSSEPLNFNSNRTTTHSLNITSAPIFSEDNWQEVLLTPENIINIKKPLSPPKRRESYSSLQDFLLNSQPAEITNSKNSTSPPLGKSPSPEKTRWAGPAFCNSPAPKDLPKPSFDKNTSSPHHSIQNHRSQSLPVLPLEILEPTKKVSSTDIPNSMEQPSKKATKKFPSSKSREESFQSSPTKKKYSTTTYVPKPKTQILQEKPQEKPQQNVPASQTPVQLEELSNQLKQMLKINLIN